MNDFTALFFVTSIGMNLMCAIVLSFSRTKEHARLFELIIGCCLIIIAFQYAIWQYHLSSDVTRALFWIKIQTTLLLIAIPPVMAVYGTWCHTKHLKRYIISFAAISAVLIALNLSLDNSLRFATDVKPTLVAFSMFKGETLHRLAGPSNQFSFLLFAYFALALISGFTWLFTQRKNIESVVFYILFLALFLQVVVSVFSALSDKGMLNLVYLGALPFTLLNILCCLTLSQFLVKKANDFEQLIYQNEALEKILVTLNGENNQDNFADFMKHVCITLQKESAATTCLILVHDQSKKETHVKSNILVHKQNVIENFSIEIDAIPKDFQDPTKFHLITENLSQDYPENEFYQNIKAQAMISVPMFNQAKEAIGVLSLYFDKPSIPEQSFINVVNVCASRLASEYSQELLLNELKETAYIDIRTKLPNLTSTYTVLKQCADDLTRHSLSCIVLKFDIDNFSDVNRVYGFENAERVLKEMAQRLISYASENVYIARTAGDEFTLVLKKLDTDFSDTLNRHWQDLSQLLQKPYVISNTEIFITVSGGSVIYPHQVPEGMDIMRCVEFALSQAKLSGKNKLMTFDADMAMRLNRQKMIERHLSELLAGNNKANEMYLVFQPKVASNGDLVGVESLCRWQHPELGFIPPIEFIQVAEATGLIQKHGLWCFEQVCAHINEWTLNTTMPTGRVGINVSAKLFDNDSFVDSVLEVLARYCVSPRSIDIELTESDLMKNLQRSKLTMKRLRELGFTISLDDFGTGYSSLSHLRELPIDELKIDRSFVNDCHTKDGLSILKSIISLAQNMQLSTIAEGVEEEAQVKALQELGCDLFQGYYFSHPLKADDLLKYIAS